jgi:hypothetical protein
VPEQPDPIEFRGVPRQTEIRFVVGRPEISRIRSAKRGRKGTFLSAHFSERNTSTPPGEPKLDHIAG